VCLREAGEGGSQVRWRGRWDPTGARGVASLRTRCAGSDTHGQSAREVRTVRPYVVDRNFSPFFKFQT
jgi:hypothetical protein